MVFRGKGYSHFRFLKFDNVWKKTSLLNPILFFKFSPFLIFIWFQVFPWFHPTYHRKTTMAQSNRETQVLDEVFRRSISKGVDWEVRRAQEIESSMWHNSPSWWTRICCPSQCLVCRQSVFPDFVCNAVKRSRNRKKIRRSQRSNLTSLDGGASVYLHRKSKTQLI